MEQEEIQNTEIEQAEITDAAETEHSSEEREGGEENREKPRYRRRGIGLLRKEPPALDRRSIALLLVITLIYSLLAFYRLGTTKIPQTSIKLVKNKQTVTVALDEPQEISRFCFYKWEGRKKDITVQVCSAETGEWTTAYGPSELSSHMRWKNLDLDCEGPVSHVRITFEGKNITLAEVVVVNTAGEKCAIHVPKELNKSLRDSDKLDNLTDEQDLFDPDSSTKTYAYFDEYLYALTSYDYLHGGSGLENTHPVLGKVLMAIGITLLGMNSWGWRIFGTLSGILMLPVMFFLARRVTGSNKWALVATFLMSVESMHYTQTRLATIDSFPLLFILLGYLFMLRYYQLPTTKGEGKALFLSGASFGLACAFKWIGMYSGVGLAICFFTFFISKCRMYKEEDNDFSVVRYLLKTFAKCICFFVLIPVGIYVFSYFPVAFGRYSDIKDWKGIWENQLYMWDFHSTLTQTFDFSSEWWGWPIMRGAFTSYSSTTAEGLPARIIVTGNPLIWWVSVPAVLMGLWFFITGRKVNAPMLKKPVYVPEEGSDYQPVSVCFYIDRFDSGLMLSLVAYFCQYIPWMLIQRECFIYHYFASSQISILIITWLLKKLAEKTACGRMITATYCAATGLMFACMFPILNGFPIPEWMMTVLKSFLI